MHRGVVPLCRAAFALVPASSPSGLCTAAAVPSELLWLVRGWRGCLEGEKEASQGLRLTPAISTWLSFSLHSIQQCR